MLCAAAVWVAVKGVRAANSNVLVDDCIFSYVSGLKLHSSHASSLDGWEVLATPPAALRRSRLCSCTKQHEACMGVALLVVLDAR